MTKQYFYQFSQGTYSDYSVGGLFVCDHEVSEAEWDAHYEAYQTECRKRAQSAGYNYHSDEYKAYQKFKEEHNPESTFIWLHNMQPVECGEFWRDH